ncbi:MAG: hypothetical protein HN774_13145 [Bacteroidetes Order II. Incertae sedis bacterium]|jgi:hypothetical protein|nr:hypothetical protein [Bacteroidetes Order II. bacterium]
MTKKETRRKFGLSGAQIPATRLLVRELDHDFGTPAHACLAINDSEGTFTSFNSYGPAGDKRLGRNYDAEGMTHPLPAEGDEKWKKWNKRGYEPAKKAADWDVVKMTAPKVAKAPAAS